MFRLTKGKLIKMYFDAYYSDPHYFHNNIIKYCDRPFTDIQHMNEQMIQNYNSVVRSTDIVLWLGDCFFTRNQESRKNIVQRLNGRKVLLRGNHDDKASDLMFYDMGFCGIYRSDFFGEIGTYAVRYSHYPYFDPNEKDLRYSDRRPQREIGVTLVHGHTHEKNRITQDKQIHVGVDAWNYTPAPYDDVLELLKQIREEI